MIKKKAIIRNLEMLFQVCYSREQYHLSSGRHQDDVRVTFYKHLINTINSSIHLVIFSNSALLENDWWSKKLPEYKIQKRHFANNNVVSIEKEIDYIDQHLLFSFFIFVFHTFESSFRIICFECFYNDYYITRKDGKKKKRDFKNLYDVVLGKLKLLNSDREIFIEIVVKFRNSIHTNGVYLNDKENSPPPYRWKNHPYTFNHGEQIVLEKDQDLWTEYFRFTREFIDIFEDVIKCSEVQKQKHIKDITEVSE
ncbi:MAG TPA: hypothetical protein VJ799_12435 [Nitrososphaeraceae archaeon]|nr:hypothetical protein [Nitrososphaeraceae archaeon]